MSANDTCDHKHIKQEIGYLGSHEGWEMQVGLVHCTDCNEVVAVILP